jgi:hypothetical protein
MAQCLKGVTKCGETAQGRNRQASVLAKGKLSELYNDVRRVRMAAVYENESSIRKGNLACYHLLATQQVVRDAYCSDVLAHYYSESATNLTNEFDRSTLRQRN